ncbi:uncharacterized protein [Diabrotica undecimpunctata]|uniref:uncharacterized protein n=1 Tax=Diabrotica undecimpunctata TaxID=50387 RepID=UPI003B63CE6C
MSCIEFDTEKFIMEIKERPALWDLTSDEYANKNLKKNMWEEIAMVFGGSECRTVKEKNELSMKLQKKWRNIKDSFNREKRRLTGIKSGSVASRKTPYIYFNMLSFLNITNPPSNTHSSIGDQDESDDSQSTPAGSCETRMLAKKRKTRDEIETQEIKVLKDSSEAKINHDIKFFNDEDRLFMLSLVSDLKRVPQYLKLQVKQQLMNVLEEAQRHANTSEHYPDPEPKFLDHLH